MNYQFTPQGVQDWQSDLYPQADSVVRAEAEYALLRFEDWLIQRFGLNSKQQTYLAQLSHSHLRFAAEGVYFAVCHRLPVILEKPEKPTKRGAKLEELIKQFESKDGEGQTATFTGSFKARITY